VSAARTEPEYVRAEVQRALAADPLLCELGIQIAVSEAMIELRGDVATPDRRERAVELVHRLFPERRIENALTVPDLAPPAEAEAVR
jgi:osmotically-inducible protein OsmY